MLSFYLIAGGLAILAALVMVRPLIARRGTSPEQAQTDTKVFRDQLAEVDRDLARGTISETEADGARLEVSRRLLAADARAQKAAAPEPAPAGYSGMLAGIALIGVPALSVAIYLAIGAPGERDQPLAQRQSLPAMLIEVAALTPRPSQLDAERVAAARAAPDPVVDPEYRELVTQLEQAVANRPTDRTGHALLANALMRLNRWAEAAAVYAKVAELSGAEVEPETLGNQAEALVLAAGGYVSPQAERVLADALLLDPQLPIAHYYGGIALRQAGRFNEAITVWEALALRSPPDAPYLAYLTELATETRAALQEAPAVTVAPATGPTPEDMATAGEMTPEEQRAMAEGMVAQLEDRLTGRGGTAEEWLFLITSLVQLEKMEDAARIYVLADAALVDSPARGWVREQSMVLGVDVE
ncbi:MAG: c-type cytochrome biogenesis protein CcmI [Pseudomonadota bacterium]